MCVGEVGRGYEGLVGFEYEFFVFEETPDSVRAKHFKNLKPITPDMFGYSVIRNSVWSDLYRDLLANCEAMDIPIEGLHEETGPGVLEAAITVDTALAAADKAALFKTFAKVIAQRRGSVSYTHLTPPQPRGVYTSVKSQTKKQIKPHADNDP